MGKICAIADIHGDLTHLHRLKEYLEDNNISNLLLLGDYSASINAIKENEEDIRAIVQSITGIATLYAIPGNCDALEIVGILRSYGIYVHNTARKTIEHTLVFYGGSNQTPFGTPWELDEETIYNDLQNVFNQLESPEKVFLAVHVPPSNTRCDKIINGMHVGSPSIRKIIERFQPAGVLCSHIHECAGREDIIGNSKIINIGPFADRNCVIIQDQDAMHIQLP